MKIILGIFGALGIAISIMQGIEPFIEVAQWVAWLTENWTKMTRGFWAFLANLFVLHISENAADFLTGATYSIALVFGFRRLQLDRQGFVHSLFEKPFDYTRENPVVLKFIPSIVPLALFGAILSIPLVVLYKAIEFDSEQRAIGLSLGFMIFVFPVFLEKTSSTKNFVDRIYGIPADSDQSSRLSYTLLTFSVAPALALLTLLGLLLVNEIAANGENILAAYDWARCDAGIDCGNEN